MLSPHPTLRRTDLFPNRGNSLASLGYPDSLFLTYNARGALYQLLQALPSDRGNTILLPAFHCTALVEPVAHSRFRIVFYRIKPDLTIDFDDLRTKAASDVAAVVVIHFFGFPVDLRELLALRQKLGFLLIEDCAHSFLTLDDGRPIGHRGDFSIYSFYKTVPSLFGGGLRVNLKSLPFNPSQSTIFAKETAVIAKRLFEQVIENSEDGLVKKTYRYLETRRLARKQSTASVAQSSASSFADDPYLFRADLAQARIPRLCKRVLLSSDWAAAMAARRRNYAALSNTLRHTPIFRSLYPDLPGAVCPWTYPVLLEDRPRYEHQLRARGVPLFTFGEVLHPFLAKADLRSRTDAEALSSRLMMLPVHQNLTEYDVLQFAEETNRFVAAIPMAQVRSASSTDTVTADLTEWRGRL
jgi:perosamine synthetase